MKHMVLTLAFGMAALTGCGGNKAGIELDDLPDDPDEVVLFSIDGPGRNSGRLMPARDQGEWLYGFPVFGSVPITDTSQRRAVVSAMKEAARNNSGRSASCFNPRHVLRVLKAGKGADMVICFECSNYTLRRPGEPESRSGGVIASNAQPVLDKFLTDANIRIAPKIGH